MEEVEKKKRKKVPAYKSVAVDGSISSVSNAFDIIEELAGECREIVDNASEGLSETQRIQTFSETADNLENVSSVDAPECISEHGMSYHEQVNTNKSRGPSRAVRLENAVSILGTAVELARSLIEDDEFKATIEADKWEEVEGEITEFADEVEEVINTIEGCEFPGMYG